MPQSMQRALWVFSSSACSALGSCRGVWVRGVRQDQGPRGSARLRQQMPKTKLAVNNRAGWLALPTHHCVHLLPVLEPLLHGAIRQRAAGSTRRAGRQA